MKSSPNRRFALLGRVRTDASRQGDLCGGILIAGGRIIGFERAAREAAAAGVTTFDIGPTQLVQPAFRDPHLHLLGAAVAKTAIDCRAERYPTIEALLGALRDAAAHSRPGVWLRGVGFDESLIDEYRAPTARELDLAVPAHPLTLRHRTGHGAILNTAATELLNGAPGSFFEAGELVSLGDLPAQLPPISLEVIEASVADLSRELSRAGIVAVGDATETNDLGRLELIADLRDGGELAQDVVFMPSAAELPRFDSEGLGFGCSWRGIAIGQAKLVPRPDTSLAKAALPARERGWPIAVHAIDPEQVEEALAEFTRTGRTSGHRLEHVSQCLPGQIGAIAASGATVVSNPNFLVKRARKYGRELSAVEREWLYPVSSLLGLGVPVAAGSDAPVTEPRPMVSVAGAVNRGPGETRFAEAEAVDVGQAMDLVTQAAARAMGSCDARLELGAAADFVVLDRDPFDVPSAELADIRVLATFLAGEKLFSDRPLQKSGYSTPMRKAASLE